MPTVVISPQQIQELRAKFEAKLEQQSDGFHPKDLAKFRSDDKWVRRYLEHAHGNMDECMTFVWESLSWRKSFGANEITADTVRKELLELGSLFSHSVDKDGKTLFIFKAKMHAKGKFKMEEMKQLSVYWLERLEREGDGEQITLFFDMSEAGLSNMDLEYVKNLVTLFKSYYPDFLNYILIYDMAWILNAAFKIIKSWLPPEAVEKIRMLDKKSIKEYVLPEKALTAWGGQDTYTYRFEPEKPRESLMNGTMDESRRKVHFAGDDGSEDKYSIGYNSLTNDSSQPSTSIGARDKSSLLLKVMPEDELVFNGDGAEVSGKFTLTNKSSNPVAYKVKTTSPEKFRVRPSSGVLGVNQSAVIQVNLQAGYQPVNMSRDKFLILGLPIEDENISSGELTDMWKTRNRQVEQTRLRCVAAGVSVTDGISRSVGGSSGGRSDIEQQLIEIHQTVNNIVNKQEQLHSEVRVTRNLQMLTALMAAGSAIVLCYLFFVDWTDPNKHHNFSSCFP